MTKYRIFWNREKTKFGRHLDIMRKYGLPQLVTVNYFTDAEINDEIRENLNVPMKSGYIEHISIINGK
jgi:formyltetrahydrofolate synthetase